MLTEVQRQLVTAYEELAISRAASNTIMAAVASVCAEYGVDDNVLAAVNERARRAVAHLLPALVASLTDSAKQAIHRNED
jgi:hypothetical protein